MRKRLVVGLSLVALAGAACTDGALGDGADIDPVPRETLLLGTQAGPIVVEIPSGSMLFERPGTVASLGGFWLSSSTSAECSKLLEALVVSTVVA